MEPLARGHPPNRWSLTPGALLPAAVPIPRRVLTWIPRSPELPGSRQRGRAGGRAAPAFLLSLGDAACNSEIESPPNTSVVFKYSRGRLPRQGPPRPRGGFEGDEGWQLRENKIPPPTTTFFLLFLVQNSVIFSTQIKQLVRDAWVSVGMLVWGF